MDIMINKIKNINNEKQVVFFTIIKDEKEYKKAANTPILSGAELQSWLDAKIGFYWYSILYKQYPDAPTAINKSLEDIEQWITDGCIIPAILDDKGKEITPEYVVEKVPWKGTHPKVMITRVEFDKLNTIDQVKIFADLLIDD